MENHFVLLWFGSFSHTINQCTITLRKKLKSKCLPKSDSSNATEDKFTFDNLNQCTFLWTFLHLFKWNNSNVCMIIEMEERIRFIMHLCLSKFVVQFRFYFSLSVLSVSLSPNYFYITIKVRYIQKYLNCIQAWSAIRPYHEKDKT